MSIRMISWRSIFQREICILELILYEKEMWILQNNFLLRVLTAVAFVVLRNQREGIEYSEYFILGKGRTYLYFISPTLLHLAHCLQYNLFYYSSPCFYCCAQGGCYFSCLLPDGIITHISYCALSPSFFYISCHIPAKFAKETAYSVLSPA